MTGHYLIKHALAQRAECVCVCMYREACAHFMLIRDAKSSQKQNNILFLIIFYSNTAYMISVWIYKTDKHKIVSRSAEWQINMSNKFNNSSLQ